MSDSDDIPFNRDYPLKPGVVDQVRPGVRRILCDNPSPFTFTGTAKNVKSTGGSAAKFVMCSTMGISFLRRMV